MIKNRMLALAMLTCFSAKLFAQNCPTMEGAMINSCGTGSSEGANEWAVFRTSTNNDLLLSNFRFAYGTPPSYTTLIVNGSTASIFVAKPASISFTGCTTVNVVTSGAGVTIPRGNKVLLMPSTTTLTSIDLSNLCTAGQAYVLFYNPSLASGFASSGNFANTPAAGSPRGFSVNDVSTGVGACGSVAGLFNYTNGWSGNIDGNVVGFSAAGIPNYTNNGCGLILSLSYSYFNAYIKNNAVNITWTANTSSRAYFEVEKSNDGRSFTKLATVNSKSTGEHDYSFIDNNIGKGNSFYRLKLVDADGTFTYTTVSRIRSNEKGSVFINNIFPTITKTSLNIQINSDRRMNTNMQIIDLAGRVVKKQALYLIEGNNNYPVDVSSLPPGYYTITMILSEISTGRFIKQ
jgi:Secretion system C-terminal sorting domain